MKLSIITPTFNHAKYIETTIKSVLANNYQDLEYIVVDGGSTDGTQDVVARYADSITKFISEPDDGQADAINKGFTHATGEIYAYINSDDYYFPDTFAKVMRFFEENPDVDFVYGDCVFVDEGGQFHRYFTEIEPFDRFRLTTCSDFIMQPSSFWRARAYHECGGFDASLHYGFDWDLWCKMAKKGFRFHYMRELLAVNREFENTKTLSGGNKRLSELKKIIDKNKESAFPHAYYGYAYAEESMKPKEEQSLWKKIFYKLGAYKSIIYNQKHWNDRNLYGINHHSPILRQEASVTFPWYDSAKHIVLFLSTPPQIKEQKIRISICAKKEIDYEFGKNKHVGMLLIDVSDIDLTRLYVTLVFEKSINKAFGLKNRLLGRKVECAAFMSHIALLDYNTSSNIHKHYNLQYIVQDGDIKLLKL